jgi:hypothetical protein
MDEDRRNNSVLQAEINGLQNLFNEKISNLMSLNNTSNQQNNEDHRELKATVLDLNATLKEHNGRLTAMEKIVEQGKGAGKVISGSWGIAGGAVISLIMWYLTK